MMIRKAIRKGGVRVYADVPSASRPGHSHRVVYIRTKSFRGWICVCENFLFEKIGKRRHCDHIKAVRKAIA